MFTPDSDAMNRMRPQPACPSSAAGSACWELNAAHDVDLDHARPVGVADVVERLGLVDPEIVDQDVDVRVAAGWPGREPAAVPRSAANRIEGRGRVALPKWYWMAPAWGTRSAVLPLTITRAPSPASAEAIASPMPAVEPVTSARLPASCRSMSLPPGPLAQTAMSTTILPMAWPRSQGAGVRRLPASGREPARIEQRAGACPASLWKSARLTHDLPRAAPGRYRAASGSA